MTIQLSPQLKILKLYFTQIHVIKKIINPDIEATNYLELSLSPYLPSTEPQNLGQIPQSSPQC